MGGTTGWSGDRVEAQQWWQVALNVDPHTAAAANNLAWVYAENNENLEVALQLAQTAKAGYPERARGGLLQAEHREGS